MTSSQLRRHRDAEMAGMEIFEITPVLLGGSPIDHNNKALLTRRQHIQAVRYWNKVIRDLRSKHA